MRTLLKSSALCLVLVSFVAMTASAEEAAMRIWPPVGPPPGPSLPVLGFHSFNTGGGEQVTSVHWGSPASRMGLEPQDVIVRANGVHLSYPGAWYRAMRRAAREGVVRLTIIDCRTGYPVHRTHYLGYGGGGTLKHRSSSVARSGR